jgi:hypothetical protein
MCYSTRVPVRKLKSGKFPPAADYKVTNRMDLGSFVEKFPSNYENSDIFG